MNALVTIITVITLSILYSSCITKETGNLLKPHTSIKLEIPEPSGICPSSDEVTFYIVSDKGGVYQIDGKGRVIHEVHFKNRDLEAVTVFKKGLLIADEASSTIYNLDLPELKERSNIKLQIKKGDNSGIEGMSYDLKNNKLYVLKEKHPTSIYVYDGDFKLIIKKKIKGLADISGCTWYKDYLWIVSSESRKVLKIDPDKFEVIRSWEIDIPNAEGIAFDTDGNMLIVSDSKKKLYFFHHMRLL